MEEVNSVRAHSSPSENIPVQNSQFVKGDATRETATIIEDISAPHGYGMPSGESGTRESSTQALGRRNRIARGLGVFFLGTLAVATTLFTLHRLGYQMADLKITAVDRSSSAKVSKPLIQIRYNREKTKPTTTTGFVPVGDGHSTRSRKMKRKVKGQKSFGQQGTEF